MSSCYTDVLDIVIPGLIAISFIVAIVAIVISICVLAGAGSSDTTSRPSGDSKEGGS